MSLFRLFLLFTKIGAILLGGGYVILPILTNEFVEKRALIKQDELIDYFALSQSMPGIIAANISMFIGHRLRGKLGAVAAMIGVILVPFLCITLLASILTTLTQNIYIQTALKGVGIAVIALIILTIREIWQKTEQDSFFYTIFILATSLLIFVKLSPIQTIIAVTPIGIIYKYLAKARGRK